MISNFIPLDKKCGFIGSKDLFIVTAAKLDDWQI